MTEPATVPDAVTQTAPERPPRAGQWATAVHLATLVVGFGLLLYATRLQWFHGDEWDFLADRAVLTNPLALLRPHNEHWSTLPILAYRGLYSLFGTTTYLPYMATLLAVHIVSVHLVWRLARRAGANAWIATAGAGILLLYGPGSDSILWAFQISFGGSLLFGLVFVHLVDHDGNWDRRDAWGQLAALAALACSGIGVTMVAAAGFTALLRRGIKAAIATVALPAVTFVVWLATVGRAGLETHERSFEPALIPGFIWTGLSATIDRAVGLPFVAIAVSVALAVWAVRHRAQFGSGVHVTVRRDPDRTVADWSAQAGRGRLAPVAGCALAAIVLFLIAGAGRASLGVELAASARYLYICAALLLPILIVALSDLTRDRPAWVPVAGVVLVAVAAQSGLVLQSAARDEAVREQARKGLILAAAQIGVPPGGVLFLNPDAELSPDLGLDELIAMRDRGELDADAVITEADRLSALGNLQVSFTAQPALPLGADGAAPRILALAGATTAPATVPGCLTLRSVGPALVFLVMVDAPSSLRLQTDATTAEVVLRQGDTVAKVPRVLTGPWFNTDASYLNLNISEPIRATVTLPGGASAELCDVVLAAS